jgi:hypothetical protein
MDAGGDRRRFLDPIAKSEREKWGADVSAGIWATQKIHRAGNRVTGEIIQADKIRSYRQAISKRCTVILGNGQP